MRGEERKGKKRWSRGRESGTATRAARLRCKAETRLNAASVGCRSAAPRRHHLRRAVWLSPKLCGRKSFSTMLLSVLHYIFLLTVSNATRHHFDYYDIVCRPFLCVEFLLGRSSFYALHGCCYY